MDQQLTNEPSRSICLVAYFLPAFIPLPTSIHQFQAQFLMCLSFEYQFTIIMYHSINVQNKFYFLLHIWRLENPYGNMLHFKLCYSFEMSIIRVLEPILKAKLLRFWEIIEIQSAFNQALEWKQRSLCVMSDYVQRRATLRFMWRCAEFSCGNDVRCAWFDFHRSTWIRASHMVM